MDDALSTVLARIRLGGSILSRAELGAPWGVSSRGLEGGVFHAILRGQATVAVGGQPPATLEEGDVVLLPHGSAHVLADRPKRRATPLVQLSRHEEAGVTVVTGGGSGPRTSILCGSIHFPEGTAHALLGALPEVLIARRPGMHAPGAHAGMASGALALLLDELSRPAPGRDAIVQRLVEVFVLRLLREAVEQGTLAGAGWLGGLSDPIVARALAWLHQQQGAPAAAGLPEAIGVSRSVLYERFQQLVGESPARYALRWRMEQAGRAMREQDLSVAEAAELAGYATEAAFAKAFKRVVGLPPATWRRQQLALEAA
jgi:AraC-like DNA-binding protein